jgi:quercetin dioxygenase-like cupin family protein
MKTLRISQDAMRKRVSRFRALKPLPIQNEAIPEPARDVVYARKLLSVIGLEGDSQSPISAGAPIRGAAGLTMTIAICPPGQGPSLHAHVQTYETFTVLKGRFEFLWNDDGGEHAVLEEFDTISVPPGVCRAFRNVGEEEGILQVLITGGVHDMNDIAHTPESKERIDRIQAGLSAQFEKAGFTFTAGGP